VEDCAARACAVSANSPTYREPFETSLRNTHFETFYSLTEEAGLRSVLTIRIAEILQKNRDESQ
jgi:hypothetical protein